MKNVILPIEKYIPDYIKELVPYPPGKPIEELERQYNVKNPIKLASNENPLGPSPKAIEAIKTSAKDLHRYPDGSGFYLKEALSKKYGISQEEIVLGNGSDELIDLLIRLLLKPGTRCITSHPSFLVYKKRVQSVGGENIIIPLKDFHHDLPSISKAVNEQTRLIFLDNPNNPTGSVISRQDFEQFLKDLPQDILIVLDEAYMEFCKNPDTPRGMEYLGKDSRVVTLRTFSKAYGLAGLRLGYGIMHKNIASYIERVRQPFNVNSLAQKAAIAALHDTNHFEKTLSNTWEGIKYISDQLTQLGFKVYPTNTNFLLVDISMDANLLYEEMLKKGVIIRSMASYGFNNFIRITIGTPQENERFIYSITEILEKLQEASY